MFSLNHPEPPRLVLKRPAITAISTGLHCLATKRLFTCLMRFPVSHDPKNSSNTYGNSISRAPCNNPGACKAVRFNLAMKMIVTYHPFNKQAGVDS